MLENLHVKDLALISEEEISFGPGFNILTGETGAGKSVLLDSVNLALGAKASKDVIRTGMEQALIELSFSLTEREAKALKDLGYSVEDNEVLLQRKIMPAKSICRLNGETVSQSQLREISGILLNMYGQHEHQSLLKSQTYANMLDEYAGEKVAALKNELKGKLKIYRALCDELESQGGDANARNRELEFLEFEINEIESASLKEGEDELLEKRYRTLSHAQRIRETIAEVYALTGNDDDVSALNLVGSASGRLNSISGLDDDLSGLSEEISEIEGLLSDFVHNLSDYEKNLEFDEAELAETEERLNLINRLKSKYGDTVEKIEKSLAEKIEKADKLRNYETYLTDLKSKIDNEYKVVSEICESISELRKKAAGPLSEKVVEELLELNFLDAKLEIKIEADDTCITENGYDEITFLISLNPGEELRPMNTIASGGELSRIMLALKSVFADRDDVSTLIFDEIDTGISGRTAYKVAEKMNELSKDHQILCITHLPQIASMADTHFLIEKGVKDGRTTTRIEKLDEDGSVKELARMLGADDISEEALKNAAAMKKKALK